jgi:hypothetical protein
MCRPARQRARSGYVETLEWLRAMRASGPGAPGKGARDSRYIRDFVYLGEGYFNFGRADASESRRSALRLAQSEAAC